MNRLLTLISTVVMALMLTACGEQAPKQPDVNTDNTTTEQTQDQTAAPAADASDDSAAPAADSAAPAAESTDDAAAPATESTDAAPESAGTQE